MEFKKVMVLSVTPVNKDYLVTNHLHYEINVVLDFKKLL